MKIRMRSESFDRELVGAVLIDQERNTVLLIDGQMMAPRDPLLRYFEVASASDAERDALRAAHFRIGGLREASSREDAASE